MLRPTLSYIPNIVTAPAMALFKRWPLVAWLARAMTLALLYLLIQRLLVSYLRWSSVDYGQAILWLDFALRFWPTGIAIFLVAVVVALKYSTIGAHWSVLAQGRELRWFIVFVCTVLAWPLTTLGHNYYFNQEYLQDKLLLLLLLPLIYYRPVFLFPFLLLAFLIFWQLAEPSLNNGSHFMFKLQPLYVLNLFAAFWLYYAFTGDRRIDLFLVFTLSLVAAAYWQPAFAKLKLNWLVHGELYHMPLAAHAHGWLASWSSESVVSLAKLVASFDWPMRIGVLVIEISSLFFLFRRRITVALLCVLSAFHLGVFVLYGYFIWTWIALDIGVAVLLWRDREKQQYAIFTARNLALSALLILSSNYWSTYSTLGWYDTRLSYTFHYRGRGESGTQYVIPPGFYTPYEDVFSMATFSYLIDQHLGLVGPYGITMSAERAFALQLATTKPQVLATEEMLGKNTFNARQKDRFEQFLQCYIKNRNEGERDSALVSYLRAPVQLWTARQGNIYTGQEPLTDVFVNEVTTLYDDAKLRQIRNIQVLHIVPEC